VFISIGPHTGGGTGAGTGLGTGVGFFIIINCSIHDSDPVFLQEANILLLEPAPFVAPKLIQAPETGPINLFDFIELNKPGIYK
jgi:hypothetical protein